MTDYEAIKYLVEVAEAKIRESRSDAFDGKYIEAVATARKWLDEPVPPRRGERSELWTSNQSASE